MNRNGKEFLYEIKDSIDKIIEYTLNMSFDEFKNNKLIQDAVIRRFEIISQSCLILPEGLKNRFDFIPWEKICDIKSRLVNLDFEVNTAKVWEIVKEDLPIFRDDINKVIIEADQSFFQN